MRSLDPPVLVSVFSDSGGEPLVAGVDEVGRGCLAGPVFAAAVVLASGSPIEGLRDSKRLSPAQRARLVPLIKASAISFAVAGADVGEIDSLNILQASLLAMRRAVAALNPSPVRCRVDGAVDPRLPMVTELIVGGDASDPAIMAASILAKEARDALMREMDLQYPGYGFAGHKGYGTPMHLTALDRLGPCAQHRMSFAPCRIRGPGGISSKVPVGVAGTKDCVTEMGG